MPPKQAPNGNSGEQHFGPEKGDTGQHRAQAGSTTHRAEDQWKHRAPYKVHDNDDTPFHTEWEGRCHCGKVQYQLSRAVPLAAKYCHCTTCQRLHGAPFQWASIFEKTDINFTSGQHDLGWYDATQRSRTHHLPCKVSCAYCGTPIMDEGRNMILLFPTLIRDISSERGRAAFAATCHMFYNERVVDFVADGAVKWEGIDNRSNLLDDHGKVLVEWEEGMEKGEMDRLKRKRIGEIEAEREGSGKKTYKGPQHEITEEGENGHDLRSRS